MIRALALATTLVVLAPSALAQDDPWEPAIARFEAGDAQGALAELDAIIQKRPKAGLGRYYRGVILEKLDRKPEAEAEYRTAVKLDATLAPAWNNLGALHLAAGRHKDAATALATAVKVKPDYLEAWYNLALAYRGLGQIGREVATWRKVVSLDPRSADALVQWGGALAVAGDRPGAIQAFRGAVRLAPKDAVARFNLGSLLLAAADAKGAAAELAAATRLDPKYAKAFWRLGVARRKLKDLPGSAKALTQAAKLAPGDRDVKVDLAVTLRASGKQMAARKLLEPLAKADHWPAVFYLASLDAESGQCAAAKKGFDRYLAATPKSASVETTVAQQLAACKGSK